MRILSSWVFLSVEIFCLGFLNLSIASGSEINTDDVLEISVYRHPELSATVRVDGKGMVPMPLINEVKVQGLTVSEASARIEKLLSDGYLLKPQVNIFIKNFRGQKASILGQVVKPGVYDISTKTTFLELISMAGGLTPEAGETASLKHEASKDAKGETKETEIELNRLVNQGDTSLNVQIQDGDKIFIPKAGVFFVTGEVKKPDAYKFQQKLTVMKGLAMAGGLTGKAAVDSVRIIRKANGEEKVIIDVTMDSVLMPDDVIVVPESFF